MAKKSLGQNYLRSKEVALNIVEAAELSEKDVVFEVGPGKGFLTDFLLERASKVVAIEKDDKLFEELSQKYEEEINSGKLNLVHGDILDFDLNKLPENYKLAANIPYYLTGKLLREVLGGDNQPKLAVLMLQKEVAERIVAKEGKESILSISVKVYGVPKIIRNISKTEFRPQPKVDSAVLKIENISRDFFQSTDKEVFFGVLRKGFKHKRKQLANNLSQFKNTKEALDGCNLGSQIRAEKLSPNDWKCLSRALK